MGFKKRVLQEYVFQVAVGVSVTATIIVFAVLGKLWTWPNAVVGGVLLLSGLLYLMDRLGIGVASERSRIRNWLDESGFPIQTMNDNNAIHFKVVDNVGLFTYVLQVKSGDPLYIYMPQLRTDEDRVTYFKSLTEEAQGEIWRKIRLELLRARTQYTDLKLDGDCVTISSQIGVSRTLTGVDFLREVMHVRTAGRLYLELLREHIPALNPPPPVIMQP